MKHADPLLPSIQIKNDLIDKKNRDFYYYLHRSVARTKYSLLWIYFEILEMYPFFLAGHEFTIRCRKCFFPLKARFGLRCACCLAFNSWPVYPPLESFLWLTSICWWILRSNLPDLLRLSTIVAQQFLQFGVLSRFRRPSTFFDYYQVKITMFELLKKIVRGIRYY